MKNDGSCVLSPNSLYLMMRGFEPRSLSMQVKWSITKPRLQPVPLHSCSYLRQKVLTTSFLFFHLVSGCACVHMCVIHETPYTILLRNAAHHLGEAEDARHVEPLSLTLIEHREQRDKGHCCLRSPMFPDHGNDGEKRINHFFFFKLQCDSGHFLFRFVNSAFFPPEAS